MAAKPPPRSRLRDRMACRDGSVSRPTRSDPRRRDTGHVTQGNHFVAVGGQGGIHPGEADHRCQEVINSSGPNTASTPVAVTPDRLTAIRGTSLSVIRSRCRHRARRS